MSAKGAGEAIPGPPPAVAARGAKAAAGAVPSPPAAATPPTELEQQLAASIKQAEAAKAAKAPAGAGLREQIKNLPEIKKPAATVTQADGSAVAATPDAIQQAAKRYLSRGKTVGGEVLGPTVNLPRTATRADMVSQVVNDILNAKTQGGRKLMQGVTRDQLLDAMADMPGNLRFVPLQTGSKGRIAARWVLDQADSFAQSIDEAVPEGRNLQQALEEAKQQFGAARGGAVPPKGPPTGQLRLPGRDWRPGRSLKDTALSAMGDAWNLPRGLLASFDFSYPFRQGLLMARHGKEFADSFQTGFRAFFDDGLARQTMDQIDSVSRGTLHISPLEGGRLLDREEQFLSRWLGKIPGLRRSQQASIVFINKLRADVYDTVTRAWMKTGYQPTTRDLEGLGNYISRATGYGSLGQFENAAGSIAQGFFSPRLLMARLQAPGYLFHSSPKVRMEAAKDFVTVFGALSALTTLAEVSGAADVEVDPRSSDFGKIRIGQTRIDPWGGYQQLARYATQLITGDLKAISTGQIYEATRIDTAWRFVRSKFNPATGLAYNLASGENMIGEEVSPAKWDKIIKDTIVPLFFQDMNDAIHEEGLTGAALTAPAFFGVGAQTFTKSSEDRAAQDFGSESYRDLNVLDQATLHAQMAAKGEKIEDWRRVTPYWGATDKAFELVSQSSKGAILQQYKSIDEFRDAALERFQAAGATLQDARTALKRMEKDIGIDAIELAVRKAIIARDPAIIDAMQAMYDRGDLLFPPSKELREFAAKVKAGQIQ